MRFTKKEQEKIMKNFIIDSIRNYLSSHNDVVKTIHIEYSGEKYIGNQKTIPCGPCLVIINGSWMSKRDDVRHYWVHQQTEYCEETIYVDWDNLKGMIDYFRMDFVSGYEKMKAFIQTFAETLKDESIKNDFDYYNGNSDTVTEVKASNVKAGKWYKFHSANQNKVGYGKVIYCEDGYCYVTRYFETNIHTDGDKWYDGLKYAKV
jgi:hypothetical protein